jgi:hypothetical protein
MSIYARVAAAAGKITLTAVAAAALSGWGGTGLAQAAMAIPTPSSGIGSPIPCLQGYVWRQAFPLDYVCVTPATRTQAAADDAAAGSRVQPGGGAYGPYTCIQGYVWRQIVPTDYVCVTPAVRSQAAYDNSQAQNRYLKMQLWVTNWTPPAPPTQTCTGDVCTQTDGGADGPNIQLNGDLFNYGKVGLYVYTSGGALVASWTATASSYPGYPGGAFGWHTPYLNCAAADPGSHPDNYVVARDLTSGRWSQRLTIDMSCASL